MTLLVIRHASSSAPRPQLPTQLAGHRVLCSDCASLSEVRQCLCQPQARSADWVLLDVGTADEAQWQAEGGALQAALDRGADYTGAYNGVIGVLAAGAACFAAATWWCFRDNPKSGGVNA